MAVPRITSHFFRSGTHFLAHGEVVRIIFFINISNLMVFLPEKGTENGNFINVYIKNTKEMRDDVGYSLLRNSTHWTYFCNTEKKQQ